QEKIFLFGTPVESLTKDEIELEIFPDRPDLLSYHGFKRSFLCFLEKKKGLKNYKVNKPEKDYKVFIDSSLKDIRPYTACAIIKNLKLDNEKIKELIDIQEKIHSTLGRKRKKIAIGIYPLEKIELPITFKAMEPDKIRFIPLESSREMSGLEILQRNSTGREYSHLLAGKHKFPVFIDSNKKILSMPPIINSQETGKINEKTKNIFIECSGSDFGILKKSLNMLVTTLADMGGKIYQMNLKYSRGIDEKTPNLNPEKNNISIENINKLLGLELNSKDIKKYLEKMGHNYNPKDNEVESPAWRIDILHEVDLIEDIAIAYGYDNFSPEIPKVSTIGEEDKIETIKKKISEILSGVKMQEVSNFHLTTKKFQINNMNYNEKTTDSIKINDSKTEYNILRENLSHYLMRIFSENIDSEYPQRIFELGRVFYNENNQIKEKESFSFGITPGNFTEAKQILIYLFKMLGLHDKLEFIEPESVPNYFINGRTAQINFNKNNIGFLGEINPIVLKKMKIKMPVTLSEINMESVYKELN
ncbi:MAG: phenylalanine--tRNA ligase subunit beta, partial [Nanoarchaeota archaeon]